MRIQVDFASHLSPVPNQSPVVQVEKVPVLGTEGATYINGRFLLPVPLDLDFPVSDSDYLLDGGGDIDGNDLASQGMARLLATYPQFGNVYFNPLLTDEHVDELDFTFEFHDPDTDERFTPRFQTGREAPLDDSGQMPTHTALLAQNNGTATPRPGLIVTDEIDIGPYTLDCDENEVGTDEFMLWWKLYSFDVSHDIAADYGAQSGKNEPAFRRVMEMDQEPPGFSAYISVNNGATWCQVGLLEPVAFCVKTTRIRVVFRNNSANKIYLASFAVLF